MKTIKYKGQSFDVPDYAKFIASDKDGAVWVYEYYPDCQYAAEKYMRSDGKGEKVGELEVKRGKVKEIK